MEPEISKEDGSGGAVSLSKIILDIFSKRGYTINTSVEGM